jgi:hypothetical protein
MLGPWTLLEVLPYVHVPIENCIATLCHLLASPPDPSELRNLVIGLNNPGSFAFLDLGFQFLEQVFG